MWRGGGKIEEAQVPINTIGFEKSRTSIPMKHRGEGSLEEEEAGSRSDLARSHPPARSHLGVPPVSSARCNEPDPQAITDHPQRVARSCITSIRARLREPTRSNARVCVCPRACLLVILSSLSLSLCLSSGEKVAVGPVNQSWTREKKRRLGAEPRGNRTVGRA